MLELPFMQEIEQEIRADAMQKSIVMALEVRFGAPSPDLVKLLKTVDEPDRLAQLNYLALTCQDVEKFRANLSQP